MSLTLYEQKLFFMIKKPCNVKKFGIVGFNEQHE